MTITALRAPEWVITQASKVLGQYRKNRAHPTRIRGSGNLSLKVNPRWRLLSKNQGKDWQLMTHERYNGQKDRK